MTVLGRWRDDSRSGSAVSGFNLKNEDGEPLFSALQYDIIQGPTFGQTGGTVVRGRASRAVSI